MTVALPTNGIANAEPFFIDAGGILSSPVGGYDQRLNRIGSRFGCTFTTKPMKADEARIWIARLIRGVHEKASIKFPQPGVVTQISNFASKAVAANAEIIESLNPTGAGDFRSLLEGQFFHVIVSGKSYLYQVKSQVAFVPGSTLLFPVQPMVRIPWASGANLVFLNPQIEGYVVNEAPRWSIDIAKIYGLTFTIREAE